MQGGKWSESKDVALVTAKSWLTELGYLFSIGLYRLPVVGGFYAFKSRIAKMDGAAGVRHSCRCQLLESN